MHACVCVFKCGLCEVRICCFSWWGWVGDGKKQIAITLLSVIFTYTNGYLFRPTAYRFSLLLVAVFLNKKANFRLCCDDRSYHYDGSYRRKQSNYDNMRWN